jgi:hypothetical protein
MKLSECWIGRVVMRNDDRSILPIPFTIEGIRKNLGYSGYVVRVMTPSGSLANISPDELQPYED